MKLVILFLVVVTLVGAVMDIPGHLIQPLGDVKQPDPHVMRQVYCHSYYFSKLENITEVVKQTHSLSKVIISMTELILTVNLGVLVVVGILFLK